MKTEPTINIQDEVVKIHAQYGMSEMANYQIEKLFEKYVEQFSPKIKQLEWVNRFELSDELGIKAQTPFCTYTIIDMKDSGFAEGIYLSSIDGVDVEVSSFDEGRKLAQEDFERCIKECLITE